jgi:hypothetical protein
MTRLVTQIEIDPSVTTAVDKFGFPAAYGTSSSASKTGRRNLLIFDFVKMGLVFPMQSPFRHYR